MIKKICLIILVIIAVLIVGLFVYQKCYKKEIKGNEIIATIDYSDLMDGPSYTYKIVIYDDYNTIRETTISSSLIDSKVSNIKENIYIKDSEREILKTFFKDFKKVSINQVYKAENYNISPFVINFPDNTSTICIYGSEEYQKLKDILIYKATIPEDIIN